MGAKATRFVRLSEIEIIRFVCKRDSCGAVVEMPVQQLLPQLEARKGEWVAVIQNGHCPVCGKDIIWPDPTKQPMNINIKPLETLERTLQVWRSFAPDKADIEFVIEDQREDTHHQP